MILEEATFEAFEYLPSKLSYGSHNRIFAACELCGKFRTMERRKYRTFCKSCSHLLSGGNKGKKHTKEQNAEHSKVMIGFKHTDITKAQISAALKGKYVGKNSPLYTGGKVIAAKRHKARRKNLGFKIICPIIADDVGHHVTNKYVIGIPREVHERFSGYSRKKHRALVLQWLKANGKKKYKIVIKVL